MLMSEDLITYLSEKACKLIKNDNVINFYVGINGAFEQDSFQAIIKLKNTSFPHIRIIQVISRMEDLQFNLSADNYIYPPKAKNSRKQWQLYYRNKWITENSDFIIAYNYYIRQSFKFCLRAKKRRKNHKFSKKTTKYIFRFVKINSSLFYLLPKNADKHRQPPALRQNQRQK